MTFKSDVGVLAYDEPAHPHAVTSAGGDSFGYDAVGNQFARPGGVTVTYTAFDLPMTIKQGALATATFGYDGDQRRIRKTTLDKETLYFGDLYERVTTKKGVAKTEHRYFIFSPERVVAVVTRGGDSPGTLYVHTDHLGSVDVLTNAKGGIEERRSYDPWGQRRNPVWGQPPPASFAGKTTKGFTGHEDDDDLGLVNMMGRILDPKLGRFLTTDPIVSRPLSGQGWNPYSYTSNNPLSFIDPSGFSEEPADRAQLLPASNTQIGPDGALEIVVIGRKKETNDTSAAAEVGAAAPPTDVDTTGSSPEIDPQAATTAPEDWTQNPYIQIEGGFLAGVSLGLVPFAGVGQQLLDAGEVLPHGTPEARFGLAVGQIVGGIVSVAGGITGELLGGVATTTGIGAVVGVPAIVVSTSLVVGGAGNIAAGIRGLTQSMMSSGSGSSSPQPASPARAASSGSRDLKAADIGLSGKGIAKVVGTVTDAGSTRIINVAHIEAASKGSLAGELRGALPKILNAARAEGVKTLQITGTFANPGLQQFAASQAAQYGGTFSSVGGFETLTFILR
jgi:RHS repeat-associated protein